MKPHKTLAAFIVVLVGVGVVSLGRMLWGPKGFMESTVKAGPRAQGKPNSPIHVIEYMDMQCRSCAEAVPVMKNYLYTYPDKIYWEVRFHPMVRNHLYALKASIYAECAARQNKFWDFYDQVLQAQSEWEAADNPDAVFLRLAQPLEIEIPQLQACVDHPEVKAAIMKEKDEGAAAGVNSTPTFFVNGAMAVGVKALEEAMDKILK